MAFGYEQELKAEIARLRDALDEQTGRAAWHYECLIQRDAQVARLRLTDEELDSIDLAIQQLPCGAAREKVVLYEIMQRYGFQRNRSGKGNEQ